MNILKIVKYFGLVMASTLLLGACGQKDAADEQTEKTTFPLTMDNYTASSEGAVFSKKEITYESSPISIVANKPRNSGVAYPTWIS